MKMKNDGRIKILLSFLESLPFLKTGGCADVIGAIARYIDKDRFDCRVIMPDFIFNRENTSEAEHQLDVAVEFEGSTYDVELKTAEAYGSIFYFVRCDEVFDNQVIFTQDEAQLFRYRFYQHAVLEAVRAAGFRPDILHGHDWESALQMKLVREPRFREFFGSTRTLLCIHNIIWQGDGDLAVGIENADAVMTVSETYRNEIMTPEYGIGLQGLLLQKQDRVFAIQNGVDYLSFDPEKDADIHATYSSNEGKKTNKLHFQRMHGLREDEDSFLIGMVTRLYSYKGIDLIIEAFDDIMSIPGVQFAILGDGPEDYEPALEKLAEKYPGRVAALTFFDDGEVMRSVYAGADAYLMPSKTEPCGISQMIAMRYGTVPIVRSTGGLNDTVIPYGRPESNGFAFEEYNAPEMIGAIKAAEEIYRSRRKEWNLLVENAMAVDNSWEKEIKKYEQLYDFLLEKNI